MTTSKEAIAAAREIIEQIPWNTLVENKAELLASIIQKHYAAKDAWILELETRQSESGIERDQLKTQLAMAFDAAEKGEAGRNMGIAYEECQKENVELTARVAELEKLCRELHSELVTYGELHTFDKKVEAILSPDLLNTSTTLTRLQELERKAKALDWLETQVQCELFIDASETATKGERILKIFTPEKQDDGKYMKTVGIGKSYLEAITKWIGEQLK